MSASNNENTPTGREDEPLLGGPGDATQVSDKPMPYNLVLGEFATQAAKTPWR